MKMRMSGSKHHGSAAGFTMMEAALIVSIVIILTAFSMPSLFSTIHLFQLNAAADTASWAISTTRYQAIMQGYPFQLTFNATNKTYQVASEPPGTGSFTSVGNAVPLSGSPVTLSAGTVLQFKPNGSVSATSGNSETFQISYFSRTKTITVTNYGSVSVQ